MNEPVGGEAHKDFLDALDVYRARNPEPLICPYCERPILAVRQMTMAYRQIVLQPDGSWKQDGEVEFGYPDTDVIRHDGEEGCQTVLEWRDWHEEAAERESEPDWLWPSGKEALQK